MTASRIIQYSAPGRAGILGNPSDIYGGNVISISIPVRNTCTLIRSDHWELPEDRRLWNAAISRLPIEGTWKVKWDTQVPRSSGLSGSTALLAATFACICEANNQDLGQKVEFAELVRDIELREADIVCGYQDAYMVVHGGLRNIDFTGKHPIDSGRYGEVKDVEIPGSYLLITTGVQRLSGSVHGPLRERWLSGEQYVVDSMLELAEMAKQAAKGIGYADLAAAMNKNFEIVQRLGGSGDTIDKLVADCLDNGASAAKLAGAGMGGTVIALCEDSDELQRRLSSIGYTRFLKPSPQPGLRKE